MAEQPIIIKHVRKVTHGGHSGSAWKVAYADFMTALMALFLLLWLLNAATQEQLQGVADYFAPTTVSSSQSGAGGMLGGKVLGDGAMTSQGSAPGFNQSLPPPTIGEGGDALTDPKEGGDDGANLTEAQVMELNAKREQQQFDRARQALGQAVNQIPELRKLGDSLMVDNTPEGLRIQIVDQEGLAMFPSGSAEMYGHTRALLAMIARVVQQLPEKIAISGHTDSVQFSGRGGYTNWELSSDRALATRRVLLGAGVPADRVRRVIGCADTEPTAKENPADARNRRISIVLLRNVAPAPAVEMTPPAATSAPGSGQ